MFAIFLIPIAIITTALLLDQEPEPEPVAEQIILLPGADGSVGAVTVSSSAGTRTLDRAYEAVDVTASGKLATAQESAASVAARYGEVLKAVPPPEVTFVLYFESGSSDTLTPESQAKVEELRSALLSRPAPEIAVVGHTDTVGSQQDNDRLSMERARTLQGKIEEAGISAVSIQASGRGERELLVPTADRVDESRNRRVEITIR